MQISKRQLPGTQEQEIKSVFAQLVSDLTSRDRAMMFLEDFLTETEYLALSKRLAIILYLHKGYSYEKIKRELNVSSATIATVQSGIEKELPGYMIALQYIKADEFASKWADKISGIFSKKAGTLNK